MLICLQWVSCVSFLYCIQVLILSVTPPKDSYRYFFISYVSVFKSKDLTYCFVVGFLCSLRCNKFDFFFPPAFHCVFFQFISFIYFPAAPFTIRIVSRCFTEAETQSLNPGVSAGARKNSLLTGRNLEQAYKGEPPCWNPAGERRRKGGRQDRE